VTTPPYPTTSSSNETSSSYQGIIDAFNQLRKQNAETPKYYPPNFQGIIQAVLDLKKWGQAGSGDTPPGWAPIEDEEGEIVGGNYYPPPANGALWFDRRQGRLFTWQDDGWFQTNGADGLAKITDQVPQNEVPGTFWYNDANQTLYIYDGTTWSIVGGATGAVDTMGLPLANPTRDSLRSGNAYIEEPVGLLNQSDMNKWVVQSLNNLDDGLVGTGAPVHIGSTAPANPNPGDLWYLENRLELLVYFDNYWVPASTPLADNTDFQSLSNTVSSQYGVTQTRFGHCETRLTTLENAPLRQLSLGTDYNESALVLNDSKASASSVKFLGSNGIDVSVNGSSISIDGTELEQSISNLIASSGTAADISAIKDEIDALEESVNTLLSKPDVPVAEIAVLSNAIGQMPTQADLALKADKLNPVFEGNSDFANGRLANVGSPISPGDGANKSYVDALRSYADATYVNKSSNLFNNLKIGRSDVSKPAIDFSQQALDGLSAFKFQTYGGPGTVTFGVTANPNEYAWEYSGNENFSWIGANGKIANIDKDALTAKSLVIGDFVRSAQGDQMILNKIDVKERLSAYQTALQGVKQALNSSTTFEEFKAAALTSLAGV